MFDNVALNVVIGLVFIYLLYSLLATVISEIIATYMGLRARNLKEAVDRMLNDDDEDDKGFFARLWDSFKLMKNPSNPRIDKFYNNPEIKYLGSTGIFKNPSSFKAVTFSRTLLYELNGNEELNKDVIKKEILRSINPDRKPEDVEGVTDAPLPTLDKQSAQFVLSLYNDSYGDLVKFKLQLEAWFDRTMEQCTEWYKRKIQIVLLVLGFALAWFFNADSFTVIHKLSTDKDARNNLVSMATAYIEAHPDTPNAPILTLTPAERDSLYAVKKQLEEDIANANNILGVGGWPADSVLVGFNALTKKFTYLPQVDEDVTMQMKSDSLVAGSYIHFSGDEKRCYFFKLIPLHFFGFLVTAIAISLGAPFWFDLLNKLMKLRTSQKVATDSTNTTISGDVSPLNREG